MALAQVDERRTALRARRDQLEADLGQRDRERLQAEQALEAARVRRDENRRSLLQTSASLASWYLRKEEAERRLAGHAGERDRLRDEKNRIAEEAQTNRGGWRERQEQVHARELEVSELRHRRDALCDRLREDYQLELAELYRQGGRRAAGVSRLMQAHQPAHAGLLARTGPGRGGGGNRRAAAQAEPAGQRQHGRHSGVERPGNSRGDAAACSTTT